MTQHDVMSIFRFLYDDIVDDDDFEKQRPFLAHYTSVETLEKIVLNNEIWLSNPLLMNDFEEVRAGFHYGSRALRESKSLRSAFMTEERYTLFQKSVEHVIDEYDEKHLLDTYIFCLSEHEKADADGLLSMWRGYGGDGRGVAIVFSTEGLDSLEKTPILFSKVHYASSAEREAWLTSLCDKAAIAVSQNVFGDEDIYQVAYALVERIKMAALFSKHKGFSEEREWRAVYLAERDPDKLMQQNLHYIVGPRGVEPKMRLRFEYVSGVTSEQFTLSNLVNKIILGPGASSPLAERSIRRMLNLCGQSDLADKLTHSSIPYRPLG